MALAESVVEAWTNAREQRGSYPAGIKLQSNEIQALSRWNDPDLGPILKTEEDGSHTVLDMLVIQVIVAPLLIEERLVWDLMPA